MYSKGGDGVFTLQVTNNNVKIKERMSKDQLAVLQDICSFEVEGAEYKAEAFRNRKKGGFEWDGQRRLFDIQHQTLPIGLLERVRKLFDTLGVQYEIESHRKDWSNDKIQYNILNFEAREYQRQAILASILHGNGIVKAATGGGKTTIAARTIAAFGLKAIFVVHTRDLLYQTKESFERMFPNEKIGQIGDGIIDYQNITVATMQTLAILGDVKYQSYKYDEDGTNDEAKIEADKQRKEDFAKYRHTIAVVMFDEVQRICSQTAYGTRFLFNNARYAFGYSASPWRDDCSDLMIEAAFGSRIIDITASELIEQGYLVQPIIDVYPVNNNTWSGKTYVEVYKSAIVENTMRNMQVVDHALYWHYEKKNVLILVTQIQHGEIIEDMLHMMGAKDATFISGKSGMKKRRRVIQEMREGKAPLVIASTIADVGLDVPRLEVIVEAGAGKSSVTALQRLGRIMRPFAGKETCRFVTFRDKALFLNTQIENKLKIWRTEPKFIINEY